MSISVPVVVPRVEHKRSRTSRPQGIIACRNGGRRVGSKDAVFVSF